MNAAVVKLLLALSFPAISPILYSASYDLPIMQVIDVLGMFDKIYSHETAKRSRIDDAAKREHECKPVAKWVMPLSSKVSDESQ